MKYTGEFKKAISFPLGGIGTGSISLAGNGRFQDIEIKNRPNKGSEALFTHFAIKAENENEVLDSRILMTDLQPDYMGSFERESGTGFGWGPDRGSMAGFPHFEKGEFLGEFPIATLDFEDSCFPGKVIMSAFNPLIPGQEDDSSIPAGFFEITIENTTKQNLKYTIALSCNNYYENKNGINKYSKKDDFSYIHLSNTGEKETLTYGDLSIATDCEDISFQEYWYRGNWFDNSSVYWNDFNNYGKFSNRTYNSNEQINTVYKIQDVATLAAHIEIKPLEIKKVRFVLAWSNPYTNINWKISDPSLTLEEIEERRTVKWKNYYAVLFKDSLASAEYAMKNFDRLYNLTKLYKNLIFSSSLPNEVLDAVTANVAILKSTTCLRLEDGSFYGFEGVQPHMGSCDGTCTHVWNYAYTLAFLFPKLERSARTLEYTYSMKSTGKMGFRLQLPLGSKVTDLMAAVDGQYGTVLRVYREYLISGDLDWLSSIWNSIKKSISYAWSDENPDKWDLNKDGIIEGRQHHTLDMELFSANSWLSGMYLAGLKAAIKLAEILGDDIARLEYTKIFESGIKKLNTELYNGYFFYQNINLSEKSILDNYENSCNSTNNGSASEYWSEEHGQIKYQIGEGCSIDQIVGQWHADLLGLGDIFDKDKVDQALQSIYKNNFISNMRNHVNPCRIYGLNDEQGTIICSYPKETQKPIIPVPYAEETMHGFEYAIASHLLLHGFEKEGLSCVKAVRDRYDGRKRNPWSELECGSTYARSMASYSLLLIYSGFQYNMGDKYIGFQPLHQEEGQWFWSLDTSFGHIVITKNSVKLIVSYGILCVKNLNMNNINNGVLSYNNEFIEYSILENTKIKLNKEIILHADDFIKMKFPQKI